MTCRTLHAQRTSCSALALCAHSMWRAAAKDWRTSCGGAAPGRCLTHAQVRTSHLSEGNDLIPKPPLDTHVFCKLLEDAGAVPLDE